MIPNDDEQNDSAAESDAGGFKRRNVLRTVGAGAVAGSGLIASMGAASAHELDNEDVVFCGCSQVCACGNGVLEVIVASETDSGFECSEVTVATGNSSDFSLCHEEDDRKVIGVRLDPDGDDEKVICNPHNGEQSRNPCASKALEDCDIDCDEYGQSGGPCGDAFLRNCGDSNGRPGRGKGKGRGKSQGRRGK